jgi:glyoxylase-like metal-dependent hydrolase (beta-lactamase superfamily II)
MIRKIHSLNCATFCPPCRRAVNGEGSLFEAGSMVCHCLLLETDSAGLVLIDTGLGTSDLKNPRGRLGLGFLASSRPNLDERETALRQVERLGYQSKDVRHILLTHLDLDHAGGLGDFPEANVHLLFEEKKAAETADDLLSRSRYRPAQWSHVRQWETYSGQEGEAWLGLPHAQALRGLPDDIALIPLTGHTLGHAGFGIRTPAGDLLHCGDAYFNGHSVRGASDGADTPWGLKLFQDLVAIDKPRMHANQRRLQACLQGPEAQGLRMFCAHDPEEQAQIHAFLKARES